MTILGIDQGSTHTRAAFCNDQGQILGVGFAAGASHTYDGIRVANAAGSRGDPGSSDQRCD